MNICILTPRYPFPETAGDVVRIDNIVRYLKYKGHRLTLLSFYEEGSEIENQEAKKLFDKQIIVKRYKLESLFFACIYFVTGRPLQCGYYWSPRFLKAFKRTLQNEHFDLYIAQLLRTERYLREMGVKDKSIIEMSDALSKTYSLVNVSKTRSYKKYVYKIEQSRIAKLEKEIIGIYKKVVLVSNADKVFLGNQKSLYVYTNGIKSDVNLTESYNPNKIVFVGNMRTLQNQDAVLFFTKLIFPKLKSRYPDLAFYIVGAEPGREIMQLHDGKSIIVTGYVECIEDIIKDACFAVAPVRIAAGIQNKVLMAMACRVPVLLSSLITEGIPELQNGINCYIAKSDGDYIKYCNLLIGNSTKRSEIAEAGFEMVNHYYSWRKLLEGYEEL